MSQLTTQEFCISLSDLAAFLEISPPQAKAQAELALNRKIKSPWLVPEDVRTTLLAAGYKYPQKVISVQMLKGGVAKTTSVLNMGLRAAMYGARVLFIDLDQQANLSFALGG
jgi:chromosome partitioning protein